MSFLEPYELASAIGAAVWGWIPVNAVGLSITLFQLGMALLIVWVIVSNDDVRQDELARSKQTSSQIADWADELETTVDDLHTAMERAAWLIRSGNVEDGLRELNAAIDLAEGHDEAALVDERWAKRGAA